MSSLAMDLAGIFFFFFLFVKEGNVGRKEKNRKKERKGKETESVKAGGEVA